VVLFAGFSLVMTGLLVLGQPQPLNRPPDALAPGVRLTFAVVATLLAALALALWIDPTRLAGDSPFDLPPLGGRFAGSWVGLLAVLAGWGAVRNNAEEAWLSALALVTLPAGALVAALRTLGDLEPAGTYIAALALLVVTGAVLLRSMASVRSARSRTGK
jgi:hypothetical protein